MDCKEFHPYPYQQFCIQPIIDHPAAGSAGARIQRPRR